MDGYTEGYLDKPAFTARRERSRERLVRLTAEAQGLGEEAHSQGELQRLIRGLEGVSCPVAEPLEQANWAMKRKIIGAAGKRIDMRPEEITIVLRVDPMDPPPSSADESLSHCGKRGRAAPVSRP